MKKIISYMIIFLTSYMQLSFIIPYKANADEDLNVINSDLIIPEST
jgi:hypothetical protein